MWSLKHPFSSNANAGNVPPALLEAKDLFVELLPDEPWKATDHLFQVQNAIQNFKASSEELIRSNFDRIFLSNRLKGKAYGFAVYSAIDRWGNSSQPSLAAINARAADYFKLNDRERTALTVASVLGGDDTGHDYHNASHNRKVVLQAMRLAAASPELSGRDVTKLLVAACIHDLGHNGKGNVENGVHKQFLLEQRAFDYARPYLARSGFSADDLEDIRTLLLSTDISPLGSKESPSYLFAKNPDALPSALIRLRFNTPLVKMARILQVADVASSGALCVEQSWKETCAISKEYNVENDKAVILRNFKTFLAACEPVFQALPEMHEVYGNNTEDIRQTIDAFAYNQVQPVPIALKRN